MNAESSTRRSRPPPADGRPGGEGSVRPQANGRVPSAAAMRGAVAGLAALLAITLAWWALALWPVEGVPPAWLERARAVCFNAGPSGLPDASGWLLLVGQPIGMLAVLMVIAGDSVREGLRRALRSPVGQVGITLAFGVLGTGVVLAAVRVAGAPRDAEWLAAASERVPATYPRLDRPLPEMPGLVDQRGDVFDWKRVAGRPTLLTFGFGHCATICPMTVMNARQVQDRFRAEGHEMALVVITLDPWRDTPARLPALARQFHLGARPGAGEDGAPVASYLLSGSIEAVNAALDALQVARQRVEDTGDIVHPALVYVLTPEGAIAYAASGHADLIEELARRDARRARD